MKEYFSTALGKLYNGDALEVLRETPSEFILGVDNVPFPMYNIIGKKI